MGKQSRERKARAMEKLTKRLAATEQAERHWQVSRNVAAELATVSVRTNGGQVPRMARLGGRGEHKIADPITGREYHVSVNAAIVDGKVKPKVPAKAKPSRYVPKGRQNAAATNRLLADWKAYADGTLKEARGHGIQYAKISLRRMATKPEPIRVPDMPQGNPVKAGFPISDGQGGWSR